MAAHAREKRLRLRRALTPDNSFQLAMAEAQIKSNSVINKEANLGKRRPGNLNKYIAYVQSDQFVPDVLLQPEKAMDLEIFSGINKRERVSFAPKAVVVNTNEINNDDDDDVMDSEEEAEVQRQRRHLLQDSQTQQQRRRMSLARDLLPATLTMAHAEILKLFEAIRNGLRNVEHENSNLAKEKKLSKGDKGELRRKKKKKKKLIDALADIDLDGSRSRGDKSDDVNNDKGVNEDLLGPSLPPATSSSSSMLSFFMQENSSTAHPALQRVREQKQRDQELETEVRRARDLREQCLDDLAELGSRTEELKKRADDYKEKTEKKLKQASEEWESQFQGQLERTQPLEEVCAHLRDALEHAHRERREALEVKLEPISIREKPSRKANYKMAAARKHYDVYALTQRLRHMLLRIEHEEQRRDQRASEVRYLRNEISEKKVAIATITKAVPNSKIEVRMNNNSKKKMSGNDKLAVMSPSSSSLLPMSPAPSSASLSITTASSNHT